MLNNNHSKEFFNFPWKLPPPPTIIQIKNGWWIAFRVFLKNEITTHTFQSQEERKKLCWNDCKVIGPNQCEVSTWYAQQQREFFKKMLKWLKGAKTGRPAQQPCCFSSPPFFFKLIPLPSSFSPPPPLKTRLSFAVCLSVDEGIDRPPTETRKWKERKTDQMSAQPFLVIAAGDGQSCALSQSLFFFFFGTLWLDDNNPPPLFFPVFFSACSHWIWSSVRGGPV